jgi:hypothetical protein
MASRRATGANISLKSRPSIWLKPWATRWALFLATSPSSPCLFLKTYLVPITFTSLGGSTKVQTWFLLKFSNSSCMALTQLKLERVCTTSWGSNKATKSALIKQETWEGAPYSEMISPSTRDASIAVVEVVVDWGASASSVEAGTSSGVDVDECSGSSSSLLKPYSSSSTKMLSSISLSPAHSNTSWGQGVVSSKVTSCDSTMVLVCHTWFLCQNQVHIACVPRIIYCTHTDQKCSHIAKCHEQSIFIT